MDLLGLIWEFGQVRGCPPHHYLIAPTYKIGKAKRCVLQDGAQRSKPKNYCCFMIIGAIMDQLIVNGYLWCYCHTLFYMLTTSLSLRIVMPQNSVQNRVVCVERYLRRAEVALYGTVRNGWSSSLAAVRSNRRRKAQCVVQDHYQ